MAGIAYVKIRLWNIPKTHIFGDTEGILGNLQTDIHDDDHRGRKPVITVYWEGATQAGAEELGLAPTAAKDGTTTVFQVLVKSAAATDIDTTGGHVRKVAVIGMTTNSQAGYDSYLLDPTTPVGKAGRPVESIEVLNMNGTTDVTSSRFYLRTPVHFYGIQWGSGGDDASAAIILQAPALTTLLTIAINQNESGGCTLWFPKDTEITIDQGNFNVNDATLTGQGDGMMVAFTQNLFDDFSAGADFIVTNITVNAYNPNRHIETIWLHPRKTGSLDAVANLVVTEVLVGNSETCSIEFDIHLDFPPEYYNT